MPVYERKEQPLPKLGPFVEQLDKLLEANMAKSQARAADDEDGLTEQLQQEVGYAGGYDAVRRYAQRWRQEHAAESAAAFVPLLVRARRGLSVRLEPRDRHPGRGDDGGEGCAHAALPQPHVVHPGLPARGSGDGVRRARQGVRVLPRARASAASTTT